jgi:hypothetical protein
VTITDAPTRDRLKHRRLIVHALAPEAPKEEPQTVELREYTEQQARLEAKREVDRQISGRTFPAVSSITYHHSFLPF